jgi:DNA polymerase III subunit alpha
MDSFERICADVIGRRKQEEAGQFSLFGGPSHNGASAGSDEAPISMEEYPREILLGYEKEMLGLFVSDHPLLGVEGLLSRLTDVSIASLVDRPQGDVATVGGLLAGLSKRVTRRGEVMLIATLEDLAGARVEVICFPRVAEQYAQLLRPDAIVLVKGRTDRDARDDSVKFIAMEIHEPELGKDRPVIIALPLDSCTPGVVDQLKEVLSHHPGSTQVFLQLARDEKTTVLRLGSEFWVDTSNGLHAELKALLGQRALSSI